MYHTVLPGLDVALLLNIGLGQISARHVQKCSNSELQRFKYLTIISRSHFFADETDHAIIPGLVHLCTVVIFGGGWMGGASTGLGSTGFGSQRTTLGPEKNDIREY